MTGRQDKNADKNVARSPLGQRLLASLKKQEMMRPGDRVGVAVSGGADSVALLLLLLELRGKLGIVLSVVHFNHKLRGKASDADEVFVAKLAAKHGLEFHSASVDVAKKAKKERANLEDAARRARYDYFRSLAESGDCRRIVVAHTADDQAETVLAHLFRGTGLTGLGGIHPVAGPVIRRKLLPLLQKQFQPAIVEHLSTLAELAREDDADLQGQAELRVLALAKETKGGLRIPARDIAGPRSTPRNLLKENSEDYGMAISSTGVRRRMVRHMIASIKPRAGQLGANHVETVLELARGGQSGSSLSLPGGVEVRREGDELFFLAVDRTEKTSSHAAPREYEYKIDLARGEAEVSVTELGCVFRLKVIDWPLKRAETSRDGGVLDRDRLLFPLVLRNWRPGDRLRPQGHRSAHKLKRLLNEKRVSRWERDGWPVLTSGGVLAWARGFPSAAEFAADERTRAGIVIAEEQL